MYLEDDNKNFDKMGRIYYIQVQENDLARFQFRSYDAMELIHCFGCEKII